MIEIIVACLIAFLCLVLVLVFFLTREVQTESGAAPVHPPVAGLSGACLQHSDVLLGRDDYLQMRNRPELKPVRERFWRDRRRIVLIWVGELERDVQLLWEFRRFLVRNGLHVALQEEVGILFTASWALLYLKLTRIIVFSFGPYVLRSVIRNVKLPVEQLSSRGAGLMARVPAEMKTQVERGWAEQVLILDLR